MSECQNVRMSECQNVRMSVMMKAKKARGDGLLDAIEAARVTGAVRLGAVVWSVLIYC